MNLPEDLTVAEARAIIDALVATSEVLMLEHAGTPRSVTFLALSLAAANTLGALRPASPVPMPTGRPTLKVIR